jgi:hypothetical protein
MGAKLQIFNEIMAFFFRFYCYLSLITDILPSETPQNANSRCYFQYNIAFKGIRVLKSGTQNPLIR